MKTYMGSVNGISIWVDPDMLPGAIRLQSKIMCEDKDKAYYQGRADTLDDVIAYLTSHFPITTSDYIGTLTAARDAYLTMLTEMANE